MTDEMELDVSFVCQSGEIEAMACMLAATLRQHHGNRLHLHVIEPMPQSQYGRISEAAHRFLDGMGVRWYQRENPVSHEYKIFNKLNAFQITPQTEKTLFLDSDILVRGPLDGLQPYFPSQIAARMENQQRYSEDAGAWQRAYGMFGLPVPEARWPTVDTSAWGPPYFNAGVILADSALHFSDVWSETCRLLHENEEIWQVAKDQHRGTVQIGLPVAIARLGLDYQLLSGAYHIFVNRQMRRRRLNWPEDEVRLVHYNEWTHVLSDERLGREVDQVIRDFNLELIFENAPETRAFLHELRSESYEPRRTMFLPGSRLPQDEDTAPSRDEASPLRVLLFPGAGVRVEAHGQNVRIQTDIDAVASLLRLATDLKEQTDTRVLLVLDKPLATISRWQELPGFADTAVLTHPVLDDATGRSDHIVQRLATLGELTDPQLRRAGLWELLAVAANQPHPRLRILRRQDLLMPGSDAANQAADWCGGRVLIEPEPDDITAVSSEEARTIGNVCAFIAGAFGYTLSVR